MQFFHNSNVLGSCIIHILYTGVLKLKKKNNSGVKRLNILKVKLGLQKLYAEGHAWTRRCKFPYNVLHFEAFVGNYLIRNETAEKGQ